MKPIKINQRYIDSARFLLTDPRVLRMVKELPFVGSRYNDAAITIAFARELEFVEAGIEREEFAPLESAKYIPYVSEGGEWAETIMHRNITDYGAARWITPRATDIPMVGVSAAEASRTIGEFAVGYNITYQDLAKAAFLSVKIDQEKPRIAREAIMRFHDEVAALGSTEINAKGLANATAGAANANNIYDANVEFEAGDQFDDDTPQNIIAAISNVINSVYLNTKQNHKANMVLMPLARLNQLSMRAYGVAENPTTVLDILKTRHPGVTFDSWEALKDAGTGGLDRIMAYKKDPAIVRYHAPVILKQMPPFQVDVWNLQTVMFARSGLTEIRRPMGISVADIVDDD